MAAVHGKKEIARLLISVGANVRCRDKNFATPLHCAAREGNYEIVKMLIESAERRGGSQAVSEADKTFLTLYSCFRDTSHLNV